MKTVAQPSVISGDPQATPYVLRRRREAAVLAAIEDIKSWYAGGLPPDPLAA